MSLRLLLSVLLLHAALPAADPAPSATAIGVFGRDAWPIMERLRSRGFQASYLYYGADYSDRYLRQFNVLVLAENAVVDPDVRQNHPTGVTADYDRRIRAQLQAFVAGGGGLLAFGGLDPVKPEPLNALLEPWGAALLDEQVDDPQHGFHQQRGMQWDYTWTRNILPHPVTDGVKAIFLPDRCLYGQGHQPLRLDREWTVLVRGSPLAVSRPMKQVQEQRWIDRDRPGTFASAPPLAAVRGVGSGRVAILSWSPIHGFFDYGHYLVEDIHFTRGGNGIASDGLRLLEQSLTWLAAPSMAATGAVPADAQAVLAGIPGCAWWLRADAGVERGSDGRVSAWADQAVGGLGPVRQPVAVHRPQLVENGLNGRPCIRFNGSDRWLAAAPATMAAEATALAVVRVRHQPGKTGTLLSFADADCRSAEAEFGFWAYQHQELEYGVRLRWPGLDTQRTRRAQAEGGWFVPAADAVLVVGWQRAGAALRAWVQGVEVMRAETPAALAAAPHCPRIGRLGDSANQFLDGDLGELMLWNRSLSDPERQAAEAALAARWSAPLAPAFGGHRPGPLRLRPGPPATLAWSATAAIGVPSGDQRWFRGLHGVRTVLTGGKGSIADHAAAARAAGLDFIGLLEDFTRLDAARWDALRDECRRASTSGLLVLPGYAYPRGTARDVYFKIGDVPWPQRDMCSADGSAVMNVEFDMMNPRTTSIGPFNLAGLASPFWRANAYNACAVATTIGGRTAFELDAFLALTEIRDGPRPLAIDVVDDPGQLAAAAGRFLTCYRARDLQGVALAVRDPDRFGHATQVTSGPLITHCHVENAWLTTWGRWAPGQERIRMEVRAEGDRPLTDLLVYDGTRLVRRHRLEGRSCALALNFLHDRQHDWVLVVRDAAGRTAVRSQIGATDYHHQRFMCSDRQNTLASSRDLDAQGNEVWIAAAGMQQKSIVRGFGYPDNPQVMARVPPYWDGAPGPLSEGHCNPQANLPWPVPPAEKGDQNCLFGRIRLPLASRDVICQATTWDHAAQSMREAYGTHVPLLPLEWYHAEARAFEFKKTPGSSAAMLIEGRYRMLRDGVWKSGDWWYQTRMAQWFYDFGGRVHEAAAWTLCESATGPVRSGLFPPRTNQIMEFARLAPGGFFALWDRVDAGAVFPLDRPMLLSMWLHQERCGTMLGYDDAMGRPFRAGDVIPFRLVVYTGATGGPPDTRAIEDFRTSFGLHGGPPAYRVECARGSLLSTAYVLDLQAEDGLFIGRIGKAALQQRLPVRLHGVNPRWTCGIVDRAAGWWLPVGTMPDLAMASATAAPVESAYAALELKQDRDIALGNLVECDDPNLTLTLLPDGRGGFAIEAHNPGTAAIDTEIRTTAGFTLAPAIRARAAVPAGASVIVGPAGASP